MPTIETLIAEGQWLALAAIVLGAIVRLLKSDTRLPIDVPAQHRPALAWALGLVQGVLVLVATGVPLRAAVIAVGSPLLAQAGHVVLVEKLRGGRELPIPGLMRPQDRAAVLPVAFVLLALLSVGCAGSFEEARNPRVAVGAPPQSDRCATLDDRAAFYGGASKGTAVLAGGAGLATIPVEDERARVGLAIGSAAMGAVAAGAGFVSSSAATSWARECSR